VNSGWVTSEVSIYRKSTQGHEHETQGKQWSIASLRSEWEETSSSTWKIGTFRLHFRMIHPLLLLSGASVLGLTD
jgi:hypothetical protein